MAILTRWITLSTLLLNIAACKDVNALPSAQRTSSQAAQVQCTSRPCGNTASGKDPQQEVARRQAPVCDWYHGITAFFAWSRI